MQNSLSFIPFNSENPAHYAAMEHMLPDYFDETFTNNPQDRIPDRFIPKLINLIADETARFKQWLYLCDMQGAFIGFSLFQIDTPDNPMCKREGWGFIREFYIIPAHRRRGIATQMCAFTEKYLKNQGADNIYLTADPNSGVPFWEAMGYIYTGKIDEQNDNRIYIKSPAPPR